MDAKRREELRGFIKGGASRPWVSTTELLSLLADAERVEQLESASEMLWITLANVSGGDWAQQSQEWQDAAARWRDAYFAATERVAR